MRLLVIRPQPGADATTKRIRALGYEAVLMPLFKVHPVAWDVPPAGAYDAIILSSGNAVRHAGQGLRQLCGLPAFAVGSATMKAAEDVGLQVVFTGQSNLGAVIAAASEVGHRRLLWLAGEDRTGTSVPDEMSLDIRVVYKSAALPASPNFVTAVNNVAAVLLHSPRAARHFAILCDDHDLDRSLITLAALSPQTAESAGSGWKQIFGAAEPNDAALLSEVQRCFTNGNCDP